LYSDVATQGIHPPLPEAAHQHYTNDPQHSRFWLDNEELLHYINNEVK